MHRPRFNSFPRSLRLPLRVHFPGSTAVLTLCDRTVSDPALRSTDVARVTCATCQTLRAFGPQLDGGAR